MIDPHNRVVLITGANRGIGLATAICLHKKGYTVSAGARDIAALSDALAPLDNERMLISNYDASDRQSQDRWVNKTLERFGRIDALVNNAGTSNTFRIDEGEESELDALWAINVKGPLFLTRACLPALRASRHGRIVNIGSLSGKRVRNDNAAYNLSKFAVMALTHGTRRLGWADGVRATAVCPSFVATDLTAGVTKVTREEMINPADLAEMIAMVIALPNTAAVAELLVNCRLEDTL